MALQQFRKREPSLASAAEDMTVLIILANFKTEPLLDEYSMLLDRKKCPPRYTAGFRFGEVRGVAVACKYHVTGVVGDDGIRVSGCITDKLFHLLHCLFSWALLLGGNGIECREHRCIDCPRVVKESTRHFLNEFLIFWGERWGRVGVCGVLSC